MFGLGKLLTLPYALPAAGIRYCFNKIVEMAETELMDDAPVKEELLLLQLQMEEGEVDEAEYRRREAYLLVRLREIKDYRKALQEAERAEQGTEGEVAVPVVELPEELR